jgi:Scramblase
LQTVGGCLIGSVESKSVGSRREIFTNTDAYSLSMYRADGSGAGPIVYSKDVFGTTLDKRAVLLATAVSMNFDYLSLHVSGVGDEPEDDDII